MLLQIIFQEAPKWRPVLCDDMLTKVSEPGQYLQIQIRVHSVFWGGDRGEVASARSGFIARIKKPLEDLDKDYDGISVGCLESVTLMVVRMNYVTII